MTLFDYRGLLRSGVMKIPLWPSERANPIGKQKKEKYPIDVYYHYYYYAL